MATEVKVPTLGESITEGTLAEWLKQPGDAVARDEAIASLETDKVTVEVPSPVAGVMGEHKVAAGDTVAVGAVIATIEEGGAGDGSGHFLKLAGNSRRRRVSSRGFQAALVGCGPAGVLPGSRLGPLTSRAWEVNTVLPFAFPS